MCTGHLYILFYVKMKIPLETYDVKINGRGQLK